MNMYYLSSFIIACIFLLGISSPERHSHKASLVVPRVIITTDFPPLNVIPAKGCPGPAERCSDPDDIQSMVRLLLYANDLKLEGLIASAGTFANVANKQHLLDMLDLYDKVDENLKRHDPRYPSAATLKARTWQGRDKTYGRPWNEIIGNGKDSEGSEKIITIVDLPDSMPVWVCCWGGAAEVAQAVWKVSTMREPAAIEKFLKKLRVYSIGKQDGAVQWLLDNFPQLFIIVSEKNYMGMFYDMYGADSSLANADWINKHVREGHGPLGAIYPKSGFDPMKPGQQEGDTPSFLYLISAVKGLSNPEKPFMESWGGKFIQPDAKRNHWVDDPVGVSAVYKWRADMQKDFGKRADWMVE